jgi:hypothetical protein
MGRGIDFKGVSLVINYDFPPSAISYIHRIGKYKYYIKLHFFQVTLDGLVLVVFAIGPKVHEFIPGQGQWIFEGDKKP